jgi:hypothetical protein
MRTDERTLYNSAGLVGVQRGGGTVCDADVLNGRGPQFGVLGFGFPDESTAFEIRWQFVRRGSRKWAGQSGGSS